MHHNRTNVEIFAKHLMITCGLIICILGLVGNVLNLIVFSQWCNSHRRKSETKKCPNKTNSPMYLIVSSWSNIILMLYPLLTRILFDGFDIEVTNRNVVYFCKIRYFAVFTFDFLSLTCTSMALLEIFLITSEKPNLRQLNPTARRTKQIIFLIGFLCAVHNIPNIIFFEKLSSNGCTIPVHSYSYYYDYFIQIFLHGVLPTSFLSCFGILTYKQIKHLHKRKTIKKMMNVDKRFFRMIVLLSILIICTTIPYVMEQIYYRIVDDRNTHQTPYVFLFHVISSLLFYAHHAFTFYVFYFSTTNFRNQVNKIFLRNNRSCLMSNTSQKPFVISSNTQTL